MSQFQCSTETQNRTKAFQEADKTFKEAWEAFEQEYNLRFQQLEKLREDRNAKLDEVKRSIRAEVELLVEERMTFQEGPFKVQKKWSDFYIPEKLVDMLSDRGLYDSAVSAKIVAVKVEVAKYAAVKKFLEDNGVAKDFECCEDGEEDSTAISGPKAIPSPGSELKKE